MRESVNITQHSTKRLQSSLILNNSAGTSYFSTEKTKLSGQAIYAIEKHTHSKCFYSGFHEERGGVSEFFQVGAWAPYRSPLTASAKRSSSAISSGVSFTAKAPMFCFRFSILVVPGIGHTSFPWWWTHASASWAGVHPFLAAISLTRSNAVLLCSMFSGWNRGRRCKDKVCNRH